MSTRGEREENEVLREEFGRVLAYGLLRNP
jgi:hypothetical protein